MQNLFSDLFIKSVKTGSNCTDSSTTSCYGCDAECFATCYEECQETCLQVSGDFMCTGCQGSCSSYCKSALLSK